MTTPTLTITPAWDAPAGSVEIRTACRHGAYRVGFALDRQVTERVAACTAVMHHHVMLDCACMWQLWPTYRTAAAPADLDAVRSEVNKAWAQLQGVTAVQR